MDTDQAGQAQEALQALQEVRERQEQALRAAYPRLPWWALIGKALVFTAIGVAGDMDPSGMGTGFPVVILVAVAALAMLDELTERRVGIKVSSSHRTGWSALIAVAEIVTVLSVFLLAAWGLRAAEVPLASTLAGLTLGLTAAALAQPLQRLRRRALRRR